MGMFDYVKCLYPLPWPEAKDGLFQSKCTPDQYLARYEVRTNGELWRHAKSGWVHEKVTGEIQLHAFRSVDGVNYWYSVQFWFRDGVVKDVVFNKSESENQVTTAESWGNP